LVRLTIMALAGSLFDQAKASRADVEYPSMARRNRAEVVVADEIGVYHCVQGDWMGPPTLQFQGNVDGTFRTAPK